MPVSWRVDDLSVVSALVHRKRVCMDPQYRGECEWLFGNDRARAAYYGRNGLTIDALGELLFDRGFVTERPAAGDVVDLLEALFRPTGSRADVCNRVERERALAATHADLERQLEVRRKNRWRLYECACPVKIRHAGDALRARCQECGERFELKTIKRDLSNVQVAVTADETVPF